jgi:hypothetical protein
MRTCRNCQTEKPLTDFGRSAVYLTTGNRDGVSIYCRGCNQDRVRKQRAQRVARKPFVLSPSDRVMQAVRSGKRTRVEIRKSARLTWEDCTNALADLAFEKKEIYIKRVDGDAHFFIKAA